MKVSAISYSKFIRLSCFIYSKFFLFPPTLYLWDVEKTCKKVGNEDKIHSFIVSLCEHGIRLLSIVRNTVLIKNVSKDRIHNQNMVIYVALIRLYNHIKR